MLVAKFIALFGQRHLPRQPSAVENQRASRKAQRPGQTKRREMLLKERLDPLVDRAFQISRRLHAFAEPAEQPFHILFE
jgi:hypothetical protein